MTSKLILFIILLSLKLWSDNINIVLQDIHTQKEYLFDAKKAPLTNPVILHQELLLQTKAANIPSRLDFKITNTSIDGQLVTRTQPIIDGLHVEGADGVFMPGTSPSFNFSYFDLPKDLFILNAAEALEIALSYNTKSTLYNPYIEKIHGSYEKIWLAHYGELRPAYKTRPPTLSVVDLQDIYIDAKNGDILKIEPSAQFIEAPSSLYIYSPAAERLSLSDLKPVMLPNLVSIKENDFLRGEYLSVRNCCHHFTCPEEGPCNDNTKRCALESHPNAQQSFELIQLPTDSLGLDPLMTLPKTISVNAIRCSYLPFAKASYQGSNNKILGFFEVPIDEPTGLASEMDRFSEIQAYNSVMTFFNHIRFLLNDPTWCLRENAMSCQPDGKPVVDAEGMPTNAYRIFVNQMIPDMHMDNRQGSDPHSFIAQILAGRGTPENPIELKKLARMGNAAFVPALSTLKVTTPRADEILSDLIKPYDHNVFFQGDRDFAYDGDVVFHEFMHAVTTSMVNKLNSLGINQWGIHSEPGSLNEGWSDYFAAAFSNRPAIGSYAAIRGGFGEASMRDIANNLRCPHDVIGEIHNDGLVWSGALWQIRQAINKKLGQTGALEFDRAVLTALAQAKTTEDFKTQSQKLLKSIAQRPLLGKNIAHIAEDILIKRGVANCFRAYQLSSVDSLNHVKIYPKKTLIVPSKNQIGLKNYAPSSSQLALAIPAGAKSLSVSWRQYLGGTGALLGVETTPDKTSNIIPLSIISSFDEPIKWQFAQATATPTRSDGPIKAPPTQAIFDNGRWQFNQRIELNRCEQRNLYLSFLSNDFKFILEDINISFEMDSSSTQSDCNFVLHQPGAILHHEPAMNCSSHQSSDFTILIILALYSLWRSKQKYLI
jgi:hypothetical protein